uniref:Uncharacterized protein n=2 Tax=Prymnesium polylepis TaxID=72548 RepID=A0A6V4U869_9EUKA|mmetsp:Transcript_60844/g.166768  ORF Transcript_60844/g.166768 Transcript_60844/m.166768 type:complete len:588 (+) Transcript_60844:1777-3540(+)
MQEKAAHRLLAQTLHQQMLEELHKNPSLAADPDQQIQFKRLAQQQLLYQMALAAQAATPGDEMQARAPIHVEVQHSVIPHDAVDEALEITEMEAMHRATWGDLEGGCGGSWAVEAPQESEPLYEVVTDNEMQDAGGALGGQMKRSGVLDSGISCTSDIEEQPTFGYNSGTDDSEGKCASATCVSIAFQPAFPRMDQRTSLLCSLLAGVYSSDARDHGGEYDEDVDCASNANQCGSRGAHISVDGKLRRKSSGIAGRSSKCPFNNRQGEDGKANGICKSAKRSEHRKVEGASLKRVKLQLAGTAGKGYLSSKVAAAMSTLTTVAVDLEQKHCASNQINDVSAKELKAPPKRRAWLNADEQAAMKFPQSAASARLLKQLADFNPSGKEDSAPNVLLPNEHEAKERGTSWRLQTDSNGSVMLGVRCDVATSDDATLALESIIEEPNIMMERGKRVCVEPDQCDQAPVELVKAREGMCDVAAHLTKHGHEHGHGHGHGSLSRQLEEHNDTMSSELRPPTSANPHASLLSQALKRNSSSAALPVCAQDAEQTTRSWISSRDEDTSLWRDASMDAAGVLIALKPSDLAHDAPS